MRKHIIIIIITLNYKQYPSFIDEKSVIIHWIKHFVWFLNLLSKTCYTIFNTFLKKTCKFKTWLHNIKTTCKILIIGLLILANKNKISKPKNSNLQNYNIRAVILILEVPERWSSGICRPFNNHQGPHHPKAHQLEAIENPLCSAECLNPGSVTNVYILVF